MLVRVFRKETEKSEDDGTVEAPIHKMGCDGDRRILEMKIL